MDQKQEESQIIQAPAHSDQLTTEADTLALSTYTAALVDTLSSIKSKVIPHEVQTISVSQTVSFFAIAYEKVRNAVEFREEHLVRRAAIERILKRRLTLNPTGKGEGENLVRELMWARYLPNNSMTTEDVERIQLVIDKYLMFRKLVVSGRSKDDRIKYTKFVSDLMTCELEEDLTPESTETKAAYLHFFYQVLKNKIRIKDVNDNLKDTYFYVASEIAYAKNDLSYIRYHLYKLTYKPMVHLSNQEIEQMASNFVDIAGSIDNTINNPYEDKIVRFAKKQVPPFLILFTIAQRYKSTLSSILKHPQELWQKVDLVCRELYQQTGKKVRTAAIRSIIYIFVTKTALVLILEYPVSKFLYGEVNITPLAINTLFPPFLMGAIVSFVSAPNEKNTKKIYERMMDIITKNPDEQTVKNVISNENKSRRPVLLLGFTLFYLLTFGITFALIYFALDRLQFHLVSKAIFIFFLSVVAFFAYRITITAKEYSVEDKQGVLSPIIDFFFIPIISVGKFLSSEISKLNVFILIFDFLIEAPFKLIFEIVEEWINFVKARKEDIL